LPEAEGPSIAITGILFSASSAIDDASMNFLVGIMFQGLLTLVSRPLLRDKC